MYSRFFRWATDRIDEGIICFISNSSFLDAISFDGFRESIQQEFSYAYIIDLGGNVRTISGKGGVFISEKHTIFGLSAMTGIAMIFLVKSNEKKARILYSNPFSVHELREDKISYLAEHDFHEVSFNHIVPDKKNNWLNLTNNNFDSLLALINKSTKNSTNEDSAVFKLYSLGNVTNRDEWLYGFDELDLSKKIKFFFEIYASEKLRWEASDKKVKINDFVDRIIKWTSELESYLIRGSKLTFTEECIRKSLYRPYTKKAFYYSRIIVHRPYQMPPIFPMQEPEKGNLAIYCTDAGTQSPFMLIATDEVPDSHLVGTTAKSLPLYRYDENGTRIDNITDWGLTQLQTHYNDPTITKENIFHYTYAVLHHPTYRTQYELNLKREFPRLPFYPNFHQWGTWGNALMDLHLHYETIEPHGLARQDIGSKAKAKAKLKADKTHGIVTLDENTQLIGVPALAWDYKLGNRSALEWILDQYKEKKPKDPTIAKLFNTYKFADYKEHVIDLLQRVCTVSVKTMEIIQQMPDTVEYKGDNAP